jgi:hypothetical protein
MAFLADKVMGRSDTQTTHMGDVLGALCVLLGFIFVNIRQEEMGFSRINSLPDNNRTSVVDEEDEDTQFRRIHNFDMIGNMSVESARKVEVC